jgi:hypothetical protein
MKLQHLLVSVLMFGVVLVAAVVQSPSASGASASDKVAYSDAPGNVHDSNGATVTNEAADAHTASITDANSSVLLTLNVYGNTDPSTDAGWNTNTSVTAYTYAAWDLVTPHAHYLAIFDTNAFASQSKGTLDGELAEADKSGVHRTSCVVTASYSSTAGYEVQFASGCIGSPSSVQWDAFIIYHPAGAPTSYYEGKDVPEEPVNPTSPVYASPVAAGGSSPVPDGYRLYASDGGVFAYGKAGFYGSTGGVKLRSPMVGAASTADSKGYWMVASDGGVFSFGDARFYGSTGGVTLVKPVVAMAPSRDGAGYWLVATDGGIFSFGDSHFFGSTGGVNLVAPVVGMAPTNDSQGYWSVASDGGIFSFGDAHFYGSLGNTKLAAPIVGMAATPSGHGYWLVAADGGIFSYGDAKFFGSTGGKPLAKPIESIVPTPDGGGYWLVASDGGVFNYGDAKFFGSAGGIQLAKPIVAISASTTVGS